MRRARQSTVEPVFGNLLYHYGLCRLNVLVQAGAHKTTLLTAVALLRPLLADVRRAWQRNRYPKAPIRALAKSLPKNGTAEPGFCNSHGDFSKPPPSYLLPREGPQVTVG